MAMSIAEQARIYPLPAYNFHVTRSGQSMRVARVSGLQREHSIITYRDGLSFLDGEVIGRFRVDQYATITLEQGVVDGDNTLHAWLETSSLQPMEVVLCNSKGIPTLAWRMVHTVPTKISAPIFDAKTNEVAIEAMELKARGISIIPTGVT